MSEVIAGLSDVIVGLSDVIAGLSDVIASLSGKRLAGEAETQRQSQCVCHSVNLKM